MKNEEKGETSESVGGKIFKGNSILSIVHLNRDYIHLS
jgi:hypothetical protein